jgi:predicted nucleic acid-binding protein
VTITIVDSGFIYALLDTDDRHHTKALSILNDSRWRFYVPSVTLVEVFKLMTNREVYGVQEQAFQIKRFAEGLTKIVEELGFEFQEITFDDYRRVVELLERYADSRIDLVDAVVVAMAERFRTHYIMTTDEKDFRRYRPDFTTAFELPLFNS